MMVKVDYVREVNPDAIGFLAGILYEFIKKERKDISKKNEGQKIKRRFEGLKNGGPSCLESCLK